MDRNTLLLIVIGIVIGIIVIILWPKPEPRVEDVDHPPVKLGLSPIPRKLAAMPRPLIEYSNAASTRPLIKTPSELEQEASKVLPRPLIEYSDSALSTALEAMPSSLTALPRPLIEYSNSAAVFALEQPIGVDLSQVQPRPLVEYADGGWIMNLGPPAELLQGIK